MSFKRFDAEDIVVSADSIAAPLWTGDVITLTSFYTSSTQTGGSSGEYYHDIYNEDPSANPDTARTQFSITYADAEGSGSILYNNAIPGKSPSATVYGQYRNLVLGDEEAEFTFGGIVSDYFYAIAIDRERYKEKLLPGSFNLILGKDGNTISLIDNSRSTPTISYVDSGRVYELITGSADGTVYTGSGTSTNEYGYAGANGSYGKFLPDIGVVLLNGKVLDLPAISGGLDLQINRNPGAAITNNLIKLERALQSGSIRAQSEETVSSNFVFIRARNSEFNYSTNPSNITGSGELRHSVMINSPQTYITTVGLYNDNLDLLAVAKLSRPLLKDFTKEALIRIKLDY